jgi:hypothetical protein
MIALAVLLLTSWGVLADEKLAQNIPPPAPSIPSIVPNEPSLIAPSIAPNEPSPLSAQPKKVEQPKPEPVPEINGTTKKKVGP